MSYRVLQETKALPLSDGRAAYEVILGWDQSEQGYFLLMQDNTGWQEQSTGSPFFCHVYGLSMDGLIETLDEVYEQGYIFWPGDSELLQQLVEDREAEQLLASVG